MVKRQLELSLEHATEAGNSSRRGSLRPRPFPRRQSRSRWWFTRMRQVVDEAVESEPDSHPRH